MDVEYPENYLEARGISGPAAIDAALRRVLDSVEPMARESSAHGLSETEQATLLEGGMRLDRSGGRDLVAEGAVRFAALVQQSLSADEVATRLAVTPGRVHQLMSSGDLFSFRLDGRRLIPAFQLIGDHLVANIAQINRRLPTRTMHPLGIFNWYHTRSTELLVDDADPGSDGQMTPLEWLAEGRDPERVRFMAEHL